MYPNKVGIVAATQSAKSNVLYLHLKPKDEIIGNESFSYNNAKVD